EAEKEVNEKNKKLSDAMKELQSTKEKLIELNNELEQRVDDRTQELLAREKELNTKNQELGKVNVDLDNFIYTASHDLKSPIANLEALIGVLKEELADFATPPHLQFLGMMDTSISKLKKTILDLAEITKVQKNLEENAEQLMFAKIIKDVKDDVLFGLTEPEVSIREELHVHQVFYPSHGLRSVLYNLLSNAIKYRSSERPVIINI